MSKIKHKHIIIDETPYAGYILLKRYYLENDVDNLNKTFDVRYNIEYLNELKLKHNSLICSYCGKKDLIIYGLKEINPNRLFMATIDHFIPKSSGIDRYNKSNMIVSCHKCNNKKGSKIYNIRELKYIYHYGDKLIDLKKFIKVNTEYEVD